MQPGRSPLHHQPHLLHRGRDPGADLAKSVFCRSRRRKVGSSAGGTPCTYFAPTERANLFGQRLRLDVAHAQLSRANLSEAHVSGADLREAKLNGTVLADSDLRQLTGLERVLQIGPSPINVSALYKSQGKVPAVFLRGCGVPENLITYLDSLTGQVLEFYSCCCSYTEADVVRKVIGDFRDWQNVVAYDVALKRLIECLQSPSAKTPDT